MALTKITGEVISGISISANNEITMPSQPAFLAQPTSTQSNISTGATVTVVLGTERFDLNGDFASNTFTAPVTGKYQLNMNIRTGQLDIDAAYILFQVETSNKSYQNIQDTSALESDATYWTFNVNILADMDANDTAIVKYYQSGGGTQVDINQESYFSGFLAC